MPGSLSNKISRVSDSDTGRPVIATLSSPGKSIGAASITISDNTNWTNSSKIYFSVYNLTTTGYKDPTSQTDWVGTQAGSVISNLTLTGGTDRAYLPGAIVEQTVTAKQLKDLYDMLSNQHDVDSGSHTAITTTAITNNGNYNQSSGTFIVPNKSIEGGYLKDNSVPNVALQPTPMIRAYLNGDSVVASNAWWLLNLTAIDGVNVGGFSLDGIGGIIVPLTGVYSIRQSVTHQDNPAGGDSGATIISGVGFSDNNAGRPTEPITYYRSAYSQNISSQYYERIWQLAAGRHVYFYTQCVAPGTNANFRIKGSNAQDATTLEIIYMGPA